MRLITGLRWPLLLCALVCGIVVFVEVILGNRFNESELEVAVRRLGATGPAAFIVLFSLTGSLFIPTTLLAVLGATLFGPGPGFFYSLSGAFIAAILGFFVARTLGRDAVARWLGRRAGTLAGIDQHLQVRGFSTALIMRLIFIPNGLINVVCGLSGMRIIDYALATLLGLTPILFAVVFVTDGAKLAIFEGEWSALLEPSSLVAIGLFIVCVASPLVAGLVRSRVRTRRLVTQPFTALGEVFGDPLVACDEQESR